MPGLRDARRAAVRPARHPRDGQPGQKKGRIVVEFGSVDDLERIMGVVDQGMTPCVAAWTRIPGGAAATMEVIGDCLTIDNQRAEVTARNVPLDFTKVGGPMVKPKMVGLTRIRRIHRSVGAG